MLLLKTPCARTRGCTASCFLRDSGQGHPHEPQGCSCGETEPGELLYELA